MAEHKVLLLSPGKVQFSQSTDEVLFGQVEMGLFVCAFGNGKAGAFFLPSSRVARGSRYFDELIAGVGAKASVKILGPEEYRVQARAWAQQAKCTVAGDVEVSSFEAFFYGESGRIRLRDLGAASAPQPPAAPKPEKSAEPIVQTQAISPRVLIVDDSKTIRNLLRQILSSDPSIEVVGEAEKPSQVEGLIEKLKPNVITLDINMPEMDGVTLLQNYFPKYRIPTVMVTAISLQEGDQVLRALNIGAVDYIQKPSMNELRAMSPVIIEKIKVAASIDLKTNRKTSVSSRKVVAKGTAGLDFSTVLAIGSSTGGVQALESVFRSLPDQIAPVVVVQHIPPVFSAAFAKRLNDICPFEVKEAADGDELRPNRVLIAPGGTQMSVERKGSALVVKVFDGAPVNRHKPSVDVLFDSVAQVIGKNAIGVILTGMGADGAKGLLKMRQAGARTVAQDKESCVVFGMPREAIELGAAEQIKPLQDIPETVMGLLEKKKAA